MTPVDPISNNIGKPTTECIRFQDGFVYQLVQDASYQTPIKMNENITTKFVDLTKDGLLILKAGFAWNGVSGPTIQRNSNRRGGAFHDGLYRLIRFGCLDFIPREQIRSIADDMLREIWKKDGMWGWLVELEIKVLRKFGEDAAKPSGEPVVLTSP